MAVQMKRTGWKMKRGPVKGTGTRDEGDVTLCKERNVRYVRYLRTSGILIHNYYDRYNYAE